MTTMSTSENSKRSDFLQASLYFFLIVLYTAVIGIPCLIVTIIQPKGEANYWFICTWARILLWTCGVKTEANGQENLPSEGSFILMSTHNSHFDIPVLIKEVPRQFRIVAKKVLFKIPIFGWILSAAGYVNVDRGDKKQAFASLDKAAESVTAGMPLLIFPEGTRSPDGLLGPFKKGGFVLATKAKVPIIPVIVEGTFFVLPKTTWRVCRGPVKVTFCPPIDTLAYSYESREELMELVRKVMSQRGDLGPSPSPEPGLTTAR